MRLTVLKILIAIRTAINTESIRIAIKTFGGATVVCQLGTTDKTKSERIIIKSRYPMASTIKVVITEARIVFFVCIVYESKLVDFRPAIEAAPRSGVGPDSYRDARREEYSG